MSQQLVIRPETHGDYRAIVALILRSFREGTDYSDGTDIVALVEEIRDSPYYIPELSFVAERGGAIVGHFCYGNLFAMRRPRAQSRRIFDISSVMPPAACRFVLQKRAHSGMKRARSCVIYIWKSGLSGSARIMG